MAEGQDENLVGLFAVPVVMISSALGDVKNFMAAAWVGLCSQKPFMVMIGMSPKNYSHQLIKESGEFVVNIPRRELLEQLEFSGSCSGRDVDKWKETGLTPIPAQKVKAPLIAECPTNLECKVKNWLDIGGTDDVIIGEVVAIRGRQGYLSDGPEIKLANNIEEDNPQTGYWSIGHEIAKYRFSRQERVRPLYPVVAGQPEMGIYMVTTVTGDRSEK